MAGIGTGRIISTYFAPKLEELDKKDFESRMARYGGKQLGPNTWLLQTTKSYLIRGSYVTQVVLRQLGKYYICQIPTDKKGSISQINMAERLLDTDTGDRHGQPRNVMIDVGIDSLQIHKETDREKVYRWWIYPNETDVSRIDDSKTMIAEILGKGQKWGRAKVLIVGGTDAQRTKIADDLTNNFTVREKQIINNCLIEIVPDNRSYAGCFQGHTDSSGNIQGTPKIAVTNSSVNNSDVVIHEAIHALRQFDANRDPRLKAVKHYWGKDADLEESLTDGETTGRQRPWARGINYRSGYYHHLKIPNKTSGQLVTEDRVTITGDVDKGLKGKRVQKAIILKYPMTNIAHLKIKGNAEAIDTYREVERSLPATGKAVTTHVQMYKPDATQATDRAQDQTLKEETPGKITQWEDGKRELVRASKQSSTFRRTMPGKTGKPKKARTSSRGKVGPYFTRGGRVSRHRV